MLRSPKLGKLIEQIHFAMFKAVVLDSRGRGRGKRGKQRRERGGRWERWFKIGQGCLTIINYHNQSDLDTINI